MSTPHPTTAPVSTPPAAPPPRRTGRAGRARPAARSVLRWARAEAAQLRHAPLTLLATGTAWVLAVVTGSVVTGPSPALLDRVGASVTALAQGRVHTLLTAAVWAPGLGGYVVATLLALLVLSRLERAWGSVRFAGLAAATQVVGVGMGLLVVQVAAQGGGTWSSALAGTAAVGPSPLVAGLLLAQSARAGALWRRRTRVGLLVGLVTLVLYGGLLQDVLRLSVAVVGLGLGALLTRSSPVHLRSRSSRHETRTLVALLLVASALGAVVAALSPASAGPLSVLRFLFAVPEAGTTEVQRLCADPTTAEACADLQVQLRFDGVGPSVLAVLPAALVVLTAIGLRRGRRGAWWGAVALHAVLAALGAVLAVAALRAPSSDVALLTVGATPGTLTLVAPLVLPLLTLGVLLATRRAFGINGAPTGRRTVGQIVGLLAVALLVYTGLGLLLRGQLQPTPTWVQLVADFPVRLVPVGYLGLIEPAFLPLGGAATVLLEWTGIVVWIGVVALVVRGSGPAATTALAPDAERARAVLHQHGDHSLAQLTTWSGTRYWFSPTGSSYVGYRLVSGVAVTVGDPVGPRSERSAVVHGFVDHCRAQGWTPCFYSVTDGVAQETATLGWPQVQVAEETVLPLGSLAFTGKKFQDVRTAINKAAKAGITAEWHRYPTAPRAITDQVETISEEWVSDKGMPEMGFTLGGLDELDDDVRCLLAVDTDRTVHAITSWLPIHRDGQVIGWTLDFMRRRDTGFKGAMEFLIGTAALTFQTEGAELVSLSGAPLARNDHRTAPDAVQQLLDVLGRTLEPVYGFRSLLAFKAKFQPEYHPLLMTFPELAALPRIGTALTHAYLPHLTTRQALRLLAKL